MELWPGSSAFPPGVIVWVYYGLLILSRPVIAWSMVAVVIGTRDENGVSIRMVMVIIS